ncbi:hypothetical protein JST97_05145 [bacterium]|nr:hypothetical protein [bacterium]
MQIQQFKSNQNPVRSLKAPQNPTPPTPPPTSGDQVEVKGPSLLAGAGGVLAGTVAGLASGGAALLVTHELGRVINATTPTISHLAPGTTGILLQVAAAALVGTAAAAVAGSVAGARVANAAATGATKPDITANSSAVQGKKLLEQAGAELREHLASVKSAQGTKAAAGAGFRAGAALGGPAGAAAGKIQGIILGAAMGSVAAVPLMGLIAHPAVLIPGALAGAWLGHKIGEPVGYAAGALALGSLGAAGGAIYHGVAGSQGDN